MKGARDSGTDELPQRLRWAISPNLPPATTHRVSLVSAVKIIRPASLSNALPLLLNRRPSPGMRGIICAAGLRGMLLDWQLRSGRSIANRQRIRTCFPSCRTCANRYPLLAVRASMANVAGQRYPLRPCFECGCARPRCPGSSSRPTSQVLCLRPSSW